jgi:HlyD family secretion protein
MGCFSETQTQALGTIERDRVTFTATANEIIRQQPVQEGSFVSKGQVLVQLDSKRQEAVVAHAVALVAKADAQLLKLTNGERPEDIAAAQASVSRAEARLVQAEKNYIRQSELVAKKVVSQAEKDTAIAARDTAIAELDSAKEEFSKLTAGARPEEIAQAQAEQQAAVADLNLQQQILDELTIVATRDGILDTLPYNLGERVPINGIVAVIQGNRIPYARVYVPASHRVDFIVDKEVNVHIDGLDAPVLGKVRWVATEPSFTPYYALTEDERSRLVYLAEIDLATETEALPSGLPAQVDLE